MKVKKPSASVSDRPTQMTPSASSNTSEVQLLFQEFQKLAGTLPETIAPSDLDTLNSALRYLFIFLREASRAPARVLACIAGIQDCSFAAVGVFTTTSL